MNFPELDWSRQGGRYCVVRDHGTWSVSTVEPNHCEISYQPAGAEGEVSRPIPVGSNHLLTCASHTEALLAVAMVEYFGRESLTDWPVLLRDNRFQERRQMFYLPVKSGEFVFHYMDQNGDQWSKMHYESRSSTRWRNVIVSSYQTRAADKPVLIPRIWPRYIENPIAVSAAVGCALIKARITATEPPNTRRSLGMALR